MAKGTITLYKGIAKNSKKPYTALRLEAGKFTKLVFLDSALELDYLERYLDKYQLQTDTSQESTPPPVSPDDSKIDLDDDSITNTGMFD